MREQASDFGIVGLGVMGKNLLLNISDQGLNVAGLDRNREKTEAFQEETSNGALFATTSEKEFINALKKPRKIMMLVPAGDPVDSVISQLLPYLEEGDLLMDGGNSHFQETERRMDRLSGRGIHYLGVGISGGEAGARTGPSMMPGGDRKAYDLVRPILEAAAAKVNGEPCVAWMGNRSAGNYVKTVHNGIEYALMELIAEAYHFMKSVLCLSDEKIGKVFHRWNSGVLESFLMEITADIFARKDEFGDGLLLNKIMDSARQKGTGKWTSQNAMDIEVAVPAIDMAVMVRNISSYKKERSLAAALYPDSSRWLESEEEAWVEKLKHSIQFGFITVFSQGFTLLSQGSEAYNYEVNLAEVAKIWRGGCIIRAGMLNDFMEIFSENPGLGSLLLDKRIARYMPELSRDTRDCVIEAIKAEIPLAALSASISYFDLCKSSWLPVNLIQAQRDYFGSHGYERTDRPGTFHTGWKSDVT